MFRKTRTPIAITALALALAASPAAAMAANSTATSPDNRAGHNHPAPPSMVIHPSTYVLGVPDDRANRAAPASMTAPAATIVVRTSSGGGFNWSDAAIGAIAVLGLALVLGAAVGVRGHRKQVAA